MPLDADMIIFAISPPRPQHRVIALSLELSAVSTRAHILCPLAAKNQLAHVRHYFSRFGIGLRSTWSGTAYLNIESYLTRDEK